MSEFSDAQVIAQAKANGFPDAHALLSQEANLGLNGPGSSLARLAITTADGVAHTPEGLWNAAVHDYNHPLEVVKTLAGSAAIAAGLKIILPEAGPVGRVAGLAMGAWFLAGAAPGFINAYKSGLQAQTWSQMNESGQQWGNSMGQLGVNSALGFVGYKVGAGMTGNILARESFDGFADFKQNVWDGATDLSKRLLFLDNSVPTASSVGLRPNYSLDGGQAKLVDSANDAPAGKVLGPSDGNAEMNATVMLQSKASLLRMDRYIARMTEGKAAMVGDEGNAFEDRFGASQESLDALKNFASKNNLTVAESDLRSGRVFLTGKTADFQKAFGVELKEYQTDSGTVTGHSGAVTIPKDLAPHIRAVFGVDQRPAAAPNYRVQALDNNLREQETVPTAADATGSSSTDLANVSDELFMKKGGYLATDIAKAQSMPLSTGGEGQRGALISLGGGIDLADYNKFFPDHGLPQPKPLGVIKVGGAKNSPGDPLAGDIENALDAGQMQTMAPKAQIDIIIGKNNTQGLTDAIERGIFPKNGEVQNSVLSSSWGLGEGRQTTQAVNTMSILFRQAAIRGVQVVAGAGDSGARANTNFFQPEFPASDPNVTGVGGLKMILNPDGSLKSATAWDEGEHSSTGGGVSKIFKLPWWQKDVNVPNNPDTGKVGRGVPDISTNAAKATGFPVRVGGEDLVIGGTSAGAPLYAGMLLNLNAELATIGVRPITPLNPWMYARANSGIFNDVTTGSNHGFTAGKGWDAVTGLGWVNGQAMLDAMKANQTSLVPHGILPFLSGIFSGSGDPQQIEAD